jgi:hypothetical protein
MKQESKENLKPLRSLMPLENYQKSSSLMIFGIGVLLHKTPTKALETTASMPSKARGMCNE